MSSKKYADPVTKTSVLSNGLSVSTETIPGASTSTVGLWIDAGSRGDSMQASGTAHFLEVSPKRARAERAVAGSAAVVRSCAGD